MTFDPYKVLGLKADATLAAIKQAFKRQAFEHHPDHGGDEKAFTEAKQAYDILTDPALRKQYDEDGHVGPMGPDNTYSVAIERIANFFINSIEASQNVSSLEQFDFVQGAKQFFDKAIRESAVQIAAIERRISHYDRAINKLKTKRKNDIIKQMLNQHTGVLKRQIDQHRKDTRINELAREIVEDYEFEGSNLILPGQYNPFNPYQTQTRKW